MKKICSKCKEEKETTEFYKRASAKDGLKSQCRLCEKLYRTEYYQNNKETICAKHREHSKQYYINQKQWYENNKERKSLYVNNYFNSNPERRLERIFKGRIYGITGVSTNKHLFSILSGSLEVYVEYIESLWEDWMDWNNYGKEWELDHIIPTASYSSDIEDLKKCWHFTNLRPVSIIENKNKAKKLDMKLIEEYKIKHLLPV